MIRTLVIEMYGGKIDDEGDWRTLASIVGDCMTPAAFEDNFKIVKHGTQRGSRAANDYWLEGLYAVGQRTA
jgi:hypothetical protein